MKIYFIAVAIAFIFGLEYLYLMHKSEHGLNDFRFGDLAIFVLLVLMLFPFPLILLCDFHNPTATFVQNILGLGDEQ